MRKGKERKEREGEEWGVSFDILRILCINNFDARPTATIFKENPQLRNDKIECLRSEYGK